MKDHNEKNHIYWQEQLNRYVDQQLGPADHAALEEHLDICEDCSAQARFLAAMKKRLRAHREMVQMPEAVKNRILTNLNRQERKSKWSPLFSVAATILIFGLLVFSSFGSSLNHKVAALFPGREVVKASLRGTIICPDCHVAREIGCEHGTFCCNGCVPGLLDKNGEVWRVARDLKGVEFGKHFNGLYGQQVVLSGDLIFSAHMVRLDSVQTLNETLLGENQFKEPYFPKSPYRNEEKMLAVVY